MRHLSILWLAAALACAACTSPVTQTLAPAPSLGALALRIVAPPRIQATLADIERMEVSLEMASGATRERTVLKQALASATASLSFTELPTGAATLSVEAFDAPGRSLATASLTTTIVAAQTATATVSLDLAPGYAFATPAPPPTP